MNKAGVIFGFIAAVLGAVGIYLAAQVYSARSESLRKVADARTKFEATEARYRENRTAADAARSRVESLEQQWGRVYPGVPGGAVSILNEQRGQIELPIGGGNKGFNPEQKPSIHIFAVDNGASRYLGQFNVSAANANLSTSELRRPPLPGETNDWRADEYRVRTFAPTPYNQLITELTADYTIAGEALQFQQEALADIEDQARKAQAAIAARIAELDGNPNLPPETPAVLRDGLVQTLAETAAARDEVTTEVAARRQQYRDRHDELEALLRSVRELAARLPGASDRPQSQVSAVPQPLR